MQNNNYKKKLQRHRPTKFCYLLNNSLNKRWVQAQWFPRQRRQLAGWLVLPIATLLLGKAASSYLFEPEFRSPLWNSATPNPQRHSVRLQYYVSPPWSPLGPVISSVEPTIKTNTTVTPRAQLPITRDNSPLYETKGQFRAKRKITQPQKRVSMTAATIKNSLFLAGQAVGLSDKLIMQLINLFEGDIDFALDIREGDSFAVIYEELIKDGTKVIDGEILAAEFITQGKIYRAIRYVDEQGHTNYYSELGQGMRKAFLRTPLKFTRISSYFNLKRRHPVLHTIRAHRGIDYAAPYGTPVKATGDGKVRFIGTQGGYGKTVILQHGKRYSTLYAHLSGYARGIRYGKLVRQGEIIGYVGKTGLATGPHLHYEFRIDNVHQNPLTAPLSQVTPIPKKYMSDFKTKAQTLFSQLEVLTRTHASELNLNPTSGPALAVIPKFTGAMAGSRL